MIHQTPVAGSYLLKWAGDLLDVTVQLPVPRPGRAAFRTNIGFASIHRKEIIALTETGTTPLARDWHDIPMQEQAPGHFTVRIPLTEVGIFSGKACFFEANNDHPQWPAGDNLTIKVEPAFTACANTMYTAFVRQFGAARYQNPSNDQTQHHEAALDQRGYTVIPPSGTFRDLIRQLSHIQTNLRFRIVQLLPIHPIPTTYARMGRFGSAFAALDFLSVDPAMAEFDPYASPLDQFRELVEAVHGHGGFLYIDLPANHTGWAATLQTHHPDWYHRQEDGKFVSPGAWGVTWADLVELDYTDPRLCIYMAEVFLFWCRQGVNGFRCDAGYMIPAETWDYIVARVREEYPDTVFLLEGLGGPVDVTEHLLSKTDLNWAYSELFQTENRSAMDWYLPRAIALAEKCGPLIHFAETHDNNRLAARSLTYARMRTALSALLSHQGAFGMANGVEWFATEKIDVHGAASLNWDCATNQIHAIAKLNALLASHPAFSTDVHLRLVHISDANAMAVLREPAHATPHAFALLILINLDPDHAQTLAWNTHAFPAGQAWDLLQGEVHTLCGTYALEPGQVLCFTRCAADLTALHDELQRHTIHEPETLALRRRNVMALRTRLALADRSGTRIHALALTAESPDALGAAMVANPDAFCARQPGGLPHLTHWRWPHDLTRTVMVPEGHLLFVQAPHPFSATLHRGDVTEQHQFAVRFDDTTWGLFLYPQPYSESNDGTHAEQRLLTTVVYAPQNMQRHTTQLLILPPGQQARVQTRVSGQLVRKQPDLYAVLSNGAGAMAQIRAAWGEIRSQYDCLLAVNPHPRVPSDKMVFWTRCRAWLTYRGYSQAIDKTCLSHFSADPAGTFATWSFTVPCGMGKSVPLTFQLALHAEINRATLTVQRHASAAPQTLQDEVTLILRPDIEYRNFHHKTKAFTGPEQHWPKALTVAAHGFQFQPTPNDHLALTTSHGTYHPAPEWAYMVQHPEEAVRGLEAMSDLFSPGWFSCALSNDQHVQLLAEREEFETQQRAITQRDPCTEGPEMLPLPELLKAALPLYIVRRDALKTVIAGYPWFLDWGRDTLIVLRGLIAGGYHKESLEILREFGRFERNGTLPNMIRGEDDANRETSDAPLWFCVAAGELMTVIGEKETLNLVCGSRTLREVLVSILTHYRDGTPNGIRMDPATGLIFSPAHYTWMDTNYPAATPREGYPVDIQALWIAALRLVGRTIDASWMALAEQATQALTRYFMTPEGWLADCLRAQPGCSAVHAEQEDALRSNQLLAITLNVIQDRATKIDILNACENLLVPGAIRSLDDRPVKTDMSVYRDGQLLNDPHHPYQPYYLGDEDTQRKPAYHNGTAWTWPFPHYVEALFTCYGEEARQPGLSLLASAIECINTGCLCHTPEICDGHAPHHGRGCGAQAWGMSELLRVWLKLSEHRA